MNEKKEVLATMMTNDVKGLLAPLLRVYRASFKRLTLMKCLLLSPQGVNDSAAHVGPNLEISWMLKCCTLLHPQH